MVHTMQKTVYLSISSRKMVKQLMEMVRRHLCRMQKMHRICCHRFIHCQAFQPDHHIHHSHCHHFITHQNQTKTTTTTATIMASMPQLHRPPSPMKFHRRPMKFKATMQRTQPTANQWWMAPPPPRIVHQRQQSFHDPHWKPFCQLQSSHAALSLHRV